MENYKFNKLSNDDILLEKIILNETDYTIINKDNGDKILKKNNVINITNFNSIKKYDFKNSNILSCLLNNEILTKLKYKLILVDLYSLINDGAKIIKQSELNIKTTKKTDEGFYYLENLGISVQGAESNKCLSEIVNQCTKNKISLIMKIKLIDNTIINLNI